MVDAATKACIQATPPPVAPPPPDNSADQIANSFAALATAFTFGSILLALFVAAGAFVWAFHVKQRAETVAREAAETEAKKIAESLVREYLAKEAPLVLSRHSDYINDASLGETDDTQAADDIGKEAG
jgi:hypothetical protein